MSDVRNIMEAIHSLQPDTQVHVKSFDDITWIEGDEISKADIETEITRLQAEYDAQEYARNRASEYPSIQDVTVALAEKEEGDSTMWDEITAKRVGVKAKYPKP